MNDAPAVAPASPTPSPAVESAAPISPSPVTETTASPPADDFSQLGEPDDDFVEVTELAPETPAQEAAPVEPVEPAVEPSKAPEPAKPAIAEPPKALVPEPPKETAAAAAPLPSEPQNLTEQLTQHRAALIDAIAAERFKLSPEEMNALEIDAVGLLPKLHAHVYYEAVTASLKHMQNYVPQMIEKAGAVARANAEAENRFFGQFAELDRAKHLPDVLQFARLVRAANPTLAGDDFAQMVAAAVMAKHGIVRGAVNGKGNGVVPKPAAAQPFVPARAGATVKVTPEEASPWAGLGMDLEE